MGCRPGNCLTDHRRISKMTPDSDAGPPRADQNAAGIACLGSRRYCAGARRPSINTHHWSCRCGPLGCTIPRSLSRWRATADQCEAAGGRSDRALFKFRDSSRDRRASTVGVAARSTRGCADPSIGANSRAAQPSAARTVSNEYAGPRGSTVSSAHKLHFRRPAADWPRCSATRSGTAVGPPRATLPTYLHARRLSQTT